MANNINVPQTKRCQKCGEILNIFEFHKDKTRPNGHSYVCKNCRSNKNLKIQPRTDIRKKMKRNGLGWCINCLGWHPINEINKSRCRVHNNLEYRRRYSSDVKFRETIKQRVKARKRKTLPVPLDEIKYIKKLFAGKCAYCGKVADTVDHIVPIKNNGSNKNNIVPACVSCNSSKKDVDVFKWIEKTNKTPCFEFYKTYYENQGVFI